MTKIRVFLSAIAAIAALTIVGFVIWSLNSFGAVSIPEIPEKTVLLLYEQIAARLTDSVPVVSGNQAGAVQAYTPASFRFHHMPEFDHAEGMAFYVEFQDAIITGSDLQLFNGDLIYVQGGCCPGIAFMSDRVRSVDPGDVIHIDHALIVSQQWGEAFYHWLIEGLPRVVQMLDHIRVHPDLKLIVYQHPVALALLDLLGIGADRVVWYDRERIYLARIALVPSPTHFYRASSSALPRLKHILRRRIPLRYPHLVTTADPKPYTIVVQSRADATRSITNHDALVVGLRDANPDAVVVEFLHNDDFTTAIAKHFHADLIIGPHGAGLSNAIFAPDGSTMLELHPNFGNDYATEQPQRINICHQRTALRSGLHSILLVEDNGTEFTKFKTDIRRVLETVRKIRAGQFDAIDAFPVEVKVNGTDTPFFHQLFRHH